MNYSMLFAEKQSQPAACRLAALAREQKLCFQQGNCRFSVAEFTIQRHLHQFFQRVPLHVQKFAGVEVRRAAVQVACQIDVQHFLRVAGRCKVRAQILQSARSQSRLLRELARRSQLRRLTRLEVPAGTSSSVRENG